MHNLVCAWSRLSVLAILTAACGGPDAPPGADAGPVAITCADPPVALRGVAPAAVAWAVEATAPSELVDLAVLDDGVALVTATTTAPLELAGVAVAATGPKPTLVAIAVDAAGHGAWGQALLRGDADGARAVAAGGGDAWVAIFARGDVVLDPAGAARPLTLAPVDLTLLLVRAGPAGVTLVATLTGGLDWTVLALAPTPTGGVLIGGAIVGDALTITTTGAPQAYPTGQPGEPGHGWFAALDAAGRVRQVQAITGTATSAVTTLLARPDGEVAVAGRYGSFPRGQLATFGQPPASRDLVSASSDDDPAADAFVARYADAGTLLDATRVISYENGPTPVPLAELDGQLVAQVTARAYDLTFDVAPAPWVIPAAATITYALGAWAADGGFAWARASAAFDLLASGRGAALVEGVGAWVAQPGTAAELAVTLPPALSNLVLVDLDGDGAVAGARHAGFERAPQVRLGQVTVRPGCGARWFTAASATGPATLVGSTTQATSPAADGRVVLFGLTAD
ncbi:MAG: hypothetical protein R3B06_11520 [Kofleriaceae bacterium]